MSEQTLQGSDVLPPHTTTWQGPAENGAKAYYECALDDPDAWSSSYWRDSLQTPDPRYGIVGVLSRNGPFYWSDETGNHNVLSAAIRGVPPEQLGISYMQDSVCITLYTYRARGQQSRPTLQVTAPTTLAPEARRLAAELVGTLPSETALTITMHQADDGWNEFEGTAEEYQRYLSAATLGQQALQSA